MTRFLLISLLALFPIAFCTWRWKEPAWQIPVAAVMVGIGAELLLRLLVFSTGAGLTIAVFCIVSGAHLIRSDTAKSRSR